MKRYPRANKRGRQERNLKNLKIIIRLVSYLLVIHVVAILVNVSDFQGGWRQVELGRSKNVVLARIGRAASETTATVAAESAVLLLLLVLLWATATDTAASHVTSCRNLITHMSGYSVSVLMIWTLAADGRRWSAQIIGPRRRRRRERSERRVQTVAEGVAWSYSSWWSPVPTVRWRQVGQIRSRTTPIPKARWRCWIQMRTAVSGTRWATASSSSTTTTTTTTTTAAAATTRPGRGECGRSRRFVCIYHSW